jgi:hypothetical protein
MKRFMMSVVPIRISFVAFITIYINLPANYCTLNHNRMEEKEETLYKTRTRVTNEFLLEVGREIEGKKHEI